MKSNLKSRVAEGCSVALSLAALAAAPQSSFAGIPLTPQLSLDASIAVRESYDTNPLQRHGDRDPVKDSFVTSANPALALTWVPSPGQDLSLRLEYSPTVSFYHSLPDESYTDHAVSLSLRGRLSPNLTCDLSSAVRVIDGDNTAVAYREPHGSPAMGSIAMRDRRDALVFRGNYKVQYTTGDFMVRPVASIYTHDWHIAYSTAPGYCNFVNRSDFNGGVDIGYRVYNPAKAEGETQRDLWLVAGYRFGYQDQGSVGTSELVYRNTYHRALAGLEGRPFSWMKLAVLAGPDFRDYSDTTAAGFDGAHVRVYEEGSLTLTPTPADEIIFASKRWELPASGGKAAYDDSNHSITWRHRVDDKLSIIVGFGVAGGEWERPALRHDWWYVPRAAVIYQFTPNITGEVSYFSEFGRSADGFTDRDFNRHVITTGIKYTF